MTDIDQALGRHFFERLLAQLTLIWTDVAGLSLTLETVDQHMETAQMVSVSEPTLSFMMEARLSGLSATLALLIPWSAIAPVADQFAAREDRRGARSDDDAASVRRAVGDVEMTVRAEVASVAMPIEAVLALKEGDLLRLNAPAAGGITLYADKVPVHTGRPGRSGSRRAVQVTGHIGGRHERRRALDRLGQSTAEACLGVLEMFAAGKVTLGEVTARATQGRLRGRARSRGGDGGLLRRRRHGRQRLPDHLRRRALLAASMMGMDEPETRTRPSSPSSSSPPSRRP